MTQSTLEESIIILDTGDERVGNPNVRVRPGYKTIEEVTRPIVAKVLEIHTEMVPLYLDSSERMVGSSPITGYVPQTQLRVLSNADPVRDITFYGLVQVALGDQIRAYLVKGDKFNHDGDPRGYILRDEFRRQETAVRVDRLFKEREEIYQGIYFSPNDSKITK